MVAWGRVGLAPALPAGGALPAAAGAVAAVCALAPPRLAGHGQVQAPPLAVGDPALAVVVWAAAPPVGGTRC